jgi:peptidyl-prolyl cis-trans isomerase C
MKFVSLAVLCLGCALAQNPALPAPQAPAAAAVLPDLPDNAQVAVFIDDGTVLTMGELKGILNNYEAQQRQQQITHLPDFLNQLAMFHKLEKMALAEKLDQQSPFREQLLFARSQILAQAEVQKQMNPDKIDGEEIERYYEKHKETYKQVKVDAIYISFSNSAASQTGGDGKKILSEAEAKAKIAGLLEQVRKGSDFKKLAKENSDDEISRAKDGDFATLTPTDNIPDAIKAAVFALKTGEATDIIAQPNGFYIFRAREVSYKPLSELRDQIYTAIKTERFQLWIETMRTQNKAKILNPAIK